MLTLESDRFLVFGHRGASAHAPENSVEAFRLAAEQGADGVELDVRRTADGLLVIHHDAVIGDEGAIVELTGAELGDRWPGLATFPAAMAACDGLIVNIEIKNFPSDPDFDLDDSVAESVVDWVTQNDWMDRVVISSFNPDTVDRVRRLSQDVATGQLIRAGVDIVEQLAETHRRGHQALHPSAASFAIEPDLAEAAAEAAAELGMWLFVWTVDDPAAIVALRAAGLTGVITNDPAGARAALV